MTTFSVLVEHLASEFHPGSGVIDPDVILFDIGVIEPRILAKRMRSIIWNAFGAREVCTNFIRLGEGQLRSGSSAALSLHQEGYELPRQPEVLLLYCVESHDLFGKTTVASCRKLLHDRARCEVGDGEVRFYRASVQGWTPWRRILEDGGGDPRVRFALPDAHRQVEVRGTSLSAESIAELLAPTIREVAWRQGLLLAVNNWLVLHGRRQITGKTRTLFRLVF